MSNTIGRGNGSGRRGSFGVGLAWWVVTALGPASCAPPEDDHDARDVADGVVDARVDYLCDGCTRGGGCGEIDACGAGSVCDMRCWHSEGSPGGTCVFMGIAPVCPEEEAPVCGCDGVTYRNHCERLVARQPFKHDGPCGDIPCPVVCGPLRRDYPEDLPGWVNACTGPDWICTVPVDCRGCWAEMRPALSPGVSGCFWYAVCPDGRDAACEPLDPSDPLYEILGPGLIGAIPGSTECPP